MVGVTLLLQVTIYSDPMVDALSSLTEEKNGEYFYRGDDGKPVYGQYIPIPGGCGLSSVHEGLIVVWPHSLASVLHLVHCHANLFQC